MNHARLDRRLKGVNTSIAEQTFSWFRGYAASFNQTRPEFQRFIVLVYTAKHNDLVHKGEAVHLNPFSAHKKTMKKAGILRRPASHAYICKKPATNKSGVRKHVLKKKPSSR